MAVFGEISSLGMQFEDTAFKQSAALNVMVWTQGMLEA